MPLVSWGDNPRTRLHLKLHVALRLTLALMLHLVLFLTSWTAFVANKKMMELP